MGPKEAVPFDLPKGRPGLGDGEVYGVTESDTSVCVSPLLFLASGIHWQNASEHGCCVQLLQLKSGGRQCFYFFHKT